MIIPLYATLVVQRKRSEICSHLGGKPLSTLVDIGIVTLDKDICPPEKTKNLL